MNIDNIIKQYLDGQSTASLSKEYDISLYKLRRLLIANNVPIDSTRGDFKPKSNINNNFFKRIDSEEQAYILGLMYSDGNITPYLTVQGLPYSYRVRIRLQEQDNSNLKKISKCICSTDLVLIYTVDNPKWSNIASLQISNLQLGQDLISLGCTPNKSATISLPSYNEVPKELYRHFLRGFFDGDGGCTSKAPIVIGFTSNKNMCDQIQQYFKSEYAVNFRDFCDRKNGYGSITLSGRDNCYKVYKLLYSDCTLFLERKKKAIETVLIDSKRSDLSSKPIEYQQIIEARRIKTASNLELLYPKINVIPQI